MSKKRKPKNRKWGGEHVKVFKDALSLEKINDLHFDGKGNIDMLRKAFDGNEIKHEDRFMIPRVIDFLFDIIKDRNDEIEKLRHQNSQKKNGDVVVISKDEFKKFQDYFELLELLKKYHKQINDFINLKM